MISIRNTQHLGVGNENTSDKGIQVLMIDSERDQIELVKLNLENRDPKINVTGSNTVGEAISLLQARKPNCVVSDYVMPDMNGIQLHSSIMEQDIPHIIYTGNDSEEVAKAAFSVGVDEYIRKDVSSAHYDFLADRIKVAVEKKRSEFWYRSYSKKNVQNCEIWRA